MKRLFTVGILCAAAISAQTADQKKSDKPATPLKTITIPKDAVKNPNGTYSYTDKNGKKWTYVNSPFGVMKLAANDSDGESTQGLPPGTKVIDKGDTVRFERPSPFGTMNWEKKKSELTDAERKALEAQKQSATVSPEAK